MKENTDNDGPITKYDLQHKPSNSVFAKKKLKNPEFL